MTEQSATFVRSLMQHPWGLWWMQARRLARIEVRRNLLTRRAWWVYFLAFVPTVVILVHLVRERHPQYAIAEDTTVLAGIVQFYYIRLGIFFGCLGIFSRLIRGEFLGFFSASCRIGIARSSSEFINDRNAISFRSSSPSAFGSTDLPAFCLAAFS